MHPRSILSVLIAVALAAPVPAQQVSGSKTPLIVPSGQRASEAKTPPVVPSGQLKVVVIQGEGAINNIRAKSATQPVVEVRDENDKPVAGAEVVFQLPAAGPGGVFHGWMRTQTAKTNAEGQAGTTGLAPNDEPGRFNIKVTASAGGRTGSVVIGQSNAVRGGAGGQISGGRSGWWKVLGVVGAAAVVGGVVAATRNGKAAETPTNPVTITPGPITVGSPR